jgi:MFS family permease
LPAISDTANAELQVILPVPEPVVAASAEENAGATPASARNEWRIIGITSVGHTLCHTGELVFAAMLPTLAGEFDLARDQVTLLGLAGYILFGVGAVPTGLWTDRLGARRMLLVYFFGLAAAAFAVALAPGPWTLGLSLTVLGAALSIYHPAGLAMIAHGCKARGRAMGINGVAGSLGVALGPALGLVLAGIGHWRLAYVLIAAVSLVAGLVLAWLPIDESAAEAARARPKESDLPAAERSDSRGLWLLLAAMTVGGFNYRSLMTALPTFLGETSQHSALVVFIVLALGGVGQFSSGHTADRIQPAKLYMGLIVALVPLALLMAHARYEIALVAVGLLAVFMFAQQPVENSIMAHLASPRRRSTLYGVKFLLSFGLGALGSQVAGILWEETGSMAPVFDLFAVGALLMAVLAAGFRVVSAGSESRAALRAAAKP